MVPVLLDCPVVVSAMDGTHCVVSAHIVVIAMDGCPQLALRLCCEVRCPWRIAPISYFTDFDYLWMELPTVL
jgi:hypothetical protein